MKLAFVYPTHETIWCGLGQQLYRREGAFRRAIDRCDEEIRRQLGWSLVEEMLLPTGSYRLHTDIMLMEPALTAIQIGLTDIWRERGIQPDGVLGRCVGEFAAAYAAGALQPETAITLSCRISQLFEQGIGRGHLLVVEAGVSECKRLVAQSPRVLHLAAEIPGDRSLLACGWDDVEAIGVFLTTAGVAWKAAWPSFGLHSPITDCWHSWFSQSLPERHRTVGVTAIFSAMLGGRATTPLDERHWWQVIRKPLLGTRSAIQDMLRAGYDTFIEVSGRPCLLDMIREEAGRRNCNVRLVSTMHEGKTPEFTNAARSANVSELAVR